MFDITFTSRWWGNQIMELPDIEITILLRLTDMRNVNSEVVLYGMLQLNTFVYRRHYKAEGWWYGV